MVEVPSRACLCGSVDLIAIEPGTDPSYIYIAHWDMSWRGKRREPGRHMSDRGQPDRAWCSTCWPFKVTV